MSSPAVIVVRTKRFTTYELKPQKRPPLHFKSKVVKGFGRGGKQLGCPTANLEDEILSGNEETGVWVGWAKVGGVVYKCVASIGWNPFFANEKKTCEPHILHTFDKDFYGEDIEIVLNGYIRPERNFPSLEALKTAIWNDIEVAHASLDLPEFQDDKKLFS
jgi:FAD synthase